MTADPARIYLPDWREVVLLLAGELHQEGDAKVNGLVGGLLDGLGPSPSLADEARRASLIGGILRDLHQAGRASSGSSPSRRVPPRRLN